MPSLQANVCRWEPANSPEQAKLIARRLKSRDLKMKVGAYLLSTFQKNIVAGGRPSKWPPAIRLKKYGGRTGIVTGKMLKAFTVSPKGDAAVEVINRAPYSPTFHFGAKGAKAIKPRAKKYLAIPLTPLASRRRPSQIKGLFCYKSRKGNLLLARRTPSGRLSNFYVLKKKVEIPARPILTVPPRDKDALDKRVHTYGLTGAF